MSSNVLLKATVTVVEDKVCSRRYSAFTIFGIPFFSKFYAGQMLCGAGPGRDTCQVGDLFVLTRCYFLIIFNDSLTHHIRVTVVDR